MSKIIFYLENKVLKVIIIKNRQDDIIKRKINFQTKAGII
ncbi:uncharacterized conserved protein [Lactococcus lactis subsp. lactis]|uniref:Uncharacterized conserved protein n=1 Tax=Lactococcus lactis subsp. lactis TaxID=1360 RepID=A0A0B8QLT9_LACLL|nr:uncharacterized conserved protein [Lactococcus lactis subsp. lactis]